MDNRLFIFKNLIFWLHPCHHSFSCKSFNVTSIKLLIIFTCDLNMKHIHYEKWNIRLRKIITETFNFPCLQFLCSVFLPFFGCSSSACTHSVVTIKTARNFHIFHFSLFILTIQQIDYKIIKVNFTF